MEQQPSLEELLKMFEQGTEKRHGAGHALTNNIHIYAIIIRNQVSCHHTR